jgi:hypothetical protein
VESNVPNLSGSGTGDGNGDGIADSLQPNVASLPNGSGGGYVTVAAPDNSGLSLSGVQAILAPVPAAFPSTSASGGIGALSAAPGRFGIQVAPSGTTFPYGLVQFTVNHLPTGGCTAVTLYFPPNRSINSYFRYGPTRNDTAPHWYQFSYDGMTGAEVFQDSARTRVVLHLCDGKRGDDDLIANGSITDPGGPVTILPGLFYTVTPCRQLDTRSGSPISPGGTLAVVLTGAPCGIPSGATSVSVNVVATQETGSGHLTIYPADKTQPLVSSINFSAGQTRANNTVLPLSSDGTGGVKIYNGSGGTTHVVIDVNGYFQ